MSGCHVCGAACILPSGFGTLQKNRRRGISSSGWRAGVMRRCHGGSSVNRRRRVLVGAHTLGCFGSSSVAVTCARLTCQDKNSSGLNTPCATVQQNQMRERHCPAWGRRGRAHGCPGQVQLPPGGGRLQGNTSGLVLAGASQAPGAHGPARNGRALRAGLGWGGWCGSRACAQRKGAGTGVSGGGEPPCQRAQPPLQCELI